MNEQFEDQNIILNQKKKINHKNHYHHRQSSLFRVLGVKMKILYAND